MPGEENINLLFNSNIANFLLKANGVGWRVWGVERQGQILLFCILLRLNPRPLGEHLTSQLSWMADY